MKKKISPARGDCGCGSLPMPADDSSLLDIRPSDFRSLFGNTLGDVFLLVTSPNIRKSLNLINKSNLGYMVVEHLWDGDQPRRCLIDKFKEFQQAGQRCSALWIGEDEFQHFLPAQLKGIKLAGISFFSSTFSIESLSRFLSIVVNTNYERELKIEERFLEILQDSERSLFRSSEYNAEAVFEHHQAEHWFSMHGPLDFGQQSVLPTGELATLTDASGDFDFHSRFEINGKIVLKGQPVVHRGSREITSEETAREYSRLSVMKDYPVVLNVTHGFIEDVVSPTREKNPFFDELQRVFRDDERYRKIHEVGFGTHAACSPLYPNNFFPNERYPGVHFGLGLGGATSFHLDLVCTSIDVFCLLKDGCQLNLYKELGLR